MTEPKNMFCWYCTVTCRSGRVFCLRCGVTYHLACCRRNGEEIKFSRNSVRSLKECNQCSRLRHSRQLHGDENSKQIFNKISFENLNGIFGAILFRNSELNPPPPIMTTNYEESSFSQIISSEFINFQVIEEKIADNQYRCPEELLYDLRKIIGVMFIEFKKRKSAKRYFERVEPYFQDIDLCPSCVYNEYFEPHGRTLLCSFPHTPVIFINSEGINFSEKSSLTKKERERLRENLEKYPSHSPGKIIGLNQSTDLARVLFFGFDSRLSIEVPRKNLQHLRESDLDNFITQETHGKAAKAARKYIENLQRRFGPNWQFTDEIRISNLKDDLYISKPELVESSGDIQSSTREQTSDSGQIRIKLEKKDSPPESDLSLSNHLSTENRKRSLEIPQEDAALKKFIRKDPDQALEPQKVSRESDNRENVLFSLIKDDFNQHMDDIDQQLRSLKQSFEQKPDGTLWQATRRISKIIEKALETVSEYADIDSP